MRAQWYGGYYVQFQHLPMGVALIVQYWATTSAHIVVFVYCDQSQLPVRHAPRFEQPLIFAERCYSCVLVYWRTVMG